MGFPFRARPGAADSYEAAWSRPAWGTAQVVHRELFARGRAMICGRPLRRTLNKEMTWQQSSIRLVM